VCRSRNPVSSVRGTAANAATHQSEQAAGFDGAGPVPEGHYRASCVAVPATRLAGEGRFERREKKKNLVKDEQGESLEIFSSSSFDRYCYAGCAILREGLSLERPIFYPIPLESQPIIATYVVGANHPLSRRRRSRPARRRDSGATFGLAASTVGGRLDGIQGSCPLPQGSAQHDPQVDGRGGDSVHTRWPRRSLFLSPQRA